MDERQHKADREAGKTDGRFYIRRPEHGENEEADHHDFA